MGVMLHERKRAYRYLAFGLLTLLVSTSLAVTAYSGEWEDAVAAYSRGDYTTAYRLFKPMAQQGMPEAQFILGLMYDNGRGVPQDYAMAVKWYRKAAEQGIAKAQFNLGVSYEDGQGVPQNYILAYMLFDLASSALAREGRERAIKNRNSVASKMTLEQIAEAQLLAREWKPKKEVR
jgi:TPR repeat protein